jgi:hypothetical protein
MILLTPDLRFALRANAIQGHVTLDRSGRAAVAATRPEPDPVPVEKFSNPLGAATWIATELHADGVAGESRASPRLFGLADLGFRCPELGVFGLSEIASVRLPFGLSIECDIAFESSHPLSLGQKRRVSPGRFRPPSRN